MKWIAPLLLLLSISTKAQDSADIVIFDGQYFNGQSFVAFSEIVIDKGIIVHISDKRLNYAGRKVIDSKGKYIIPGLIDSHVHLFGAPGKDNEFVPAPYNAHSCLRAGVTTVVDLFSTNYREIKKLAALQPELYANIMAAGPCLAAPGGHGDVGNNPAVIGTPKDAIKWATKHGDDTAIDCIKIIYQRHSNKNALDTPRMHRIVETTHSHNKKVFAHIDHSADGLECAYSGVDVLAHIPLNKMQGSEIDSLKQSGIIIVPTITVYQAAYQGLGTDYTDDSLLRASVHPLHYKGFYHKGAPRDSDPAWWKFEVDYMYNLKKLIEKGIPVLAGTDAGNYATFYGYALHNEFEEYVKAGMSPAQAINTATKNIELVFPGCNTGSIKEGYHADLLVLNNNPLENISNTKSIYEVVNRGKLRQLIKF